MRSPCQVTAPVIVLSLALVAACSSADKTAEPVPCVPDPNEPNEAPSTPTSLGQIHDDDEPIGGQATNAMPMKVDKTFSMHAANDVDWFTVDVLDTGINGNPNLRVIVSDGFEATAFWTCSTGKAEPVVCGLGTPVTDDPDLAGAGRGCTTAKGSASPQLTMKIECTGTSTDNGSLRVRVKRLAPKDACERYRLTVFAE